MNSTEKVLYILRRLGDPPYEFSGTELANEIGCVKSGVFKIMTDLIAAGFVSQDPETKKYALGTGIYRLGCIYREHKGIIGFAEDSVKELAAIVTETVSIGVMDGKDPIIAFRIESPHGVRLHGKLGTKFPIYAGAVGKLLAAHLDSETINNLLKTIVFVKKTNKTIVDSETLLKEYEKIRQQGYALSEEENCAGAYGIAAPIRDSSGKVVACICVAGPIQRFTPSKRSEWIPLVIAAADKVSAKLGSGKFLNKYKEKE